ncbi:MAG: hypothetical protein ACOC70_02850, partial [bacterium]
RPRRTTRSDTSGIHADPADSGDTTTTDDDGGAADDDGGSTEHGEELGGDPAGDEDRDTSTDDDSGDDRDMGGHGEELGGDPAGDTGPDRTASQPPGAGPETIEPDDDDRDLPTETTAGHPEPGGEPPRRPDPSDAPEEQGIEAGGGPEGSYEVTIDGTTFSGSAQHVARALENAFLEDNPEYDADDVRVTEDFEVELTASGRRRQLDTVRTGFEAEFEEQLGLDVEADEDFQVFVQDGEFVAIPTEQLGERVQAGARGAADDLFADPAGRPGPDPDGRPPESEEAARENIERQLEEQVGVGLDPDEHIAFSRTETDDGVVIEGELSEAGQRFVAVETSPIVQALGGTVIGDEARAVAGGAFEFREFGRTQREEVVQPALDELRVATGLDTEIEQYEAFADELGAVEEDVLQPARDEVTDLVPAGLAATGVATGTRAVSLTPPGRVAVGAGLAYGAGSQALEELSPEQQRAVGEAVGTVSSPATAAQRATLGTAPADAQAELGLPPMETATEQQSEFPLDQPTEIVIDPESGQIESIRRPGEIEIFIPEREGYEFVPPEEGSELGPYRGPEVELPLEEAARRERPSDAITFPRDPPMAVQEDPIFLPEVLTPTAPTEHFTAGRYTPPEVPADTADPAEPFGGPEVQLDETEAGRSDDVFFPGPEIPAGGESFDATLEAAQELLQRELPRPEEATDPADAGRETGGGGLSFVIRRDPRVSTPYVIETPTADIDLSLVRPELARVLRAQEDAEATEFEGATQGQTGDLPPEESIPGAFGFGGVGSAQRAGEGNRLLALLGSDARQDVLTGEQATQRQQAGLGALLGQDPASLEAAGLDVSSREAVSQREGQATAQGHRQAQTAATATPALQENVMAPGFATPPANLNVPRNVFENIFETPGTDAPNRRGVSRPPLLGIGASDPSEPARVPRFFDRTFHLDFLDPLAPFDSGPRRRRDDDAAATLAGVTGIGPSD